MITLIHLCWAFFQIGLFSIGGGYAALSLIEQQAVHAYQWLTPNEYIDLITIAEMTPGPITLNSATFVGIRVGQEVGPGGIGMGILGAVLATLACILPAIIIVSILAHLYFKYQQMTMVQGILATLRPAVVGIIASAALGIIVQTLFVGGFTAGFDWIAPVLFLVTLIILRLKSINPIILIFSCGIIGGMLYLII